MKSTSEPMRYLVVVTGLLAADVVADFAVVEDRHERFTPHPVSEVVATFTDSAALTGLINRVSDLGMQLVRVEQLAMTREPTSLMHS